MDRRTALVVLGLGERADVEDVKRNYRTLAHELHPDRGGDPAQFQLLHAAYALLRTELSGADGTGTATGPKVARGRPSRDEDAAGSERRLDGTVLDDAAQQVLDVLLSTGRHRAVSRAPGAWTNRLATSLAEGGSSTLDVALRRERPGGVGADATAPVTAQVSITARSRAARRALSDLDLARLDGATWTRHRGDAASTLTTSLRSGSVPAAAHRAVAATVHALDALDWPLPEWRSDLPRN